MSNSERVAIVTGASSGIGLAVARALRAADHRVALVARTAAKLDEIVIELGPEHAASFPLDVTERAALVDLPRKVVERFGRLDVVVNNAGVNHRGLTRERTVDEVTAIFETNLMAPVLLTHAALPHLGPDGVIVNVASLAGKVPVPHEAAYSGSKSGLRAFARALDLELQLHGEHVRVLTVCPGPVDTGFFGDDISTVPDIVFSQPMSSAEDVAKAVMHALASGTQEVDVPALSGKLATLGYLSPGLFAAIRPALERLGAKKKRRYIERKQSES